MFLTDVPQSFSIMLTLPVEHREKVEVVHRRAFIFLPPVPNEQDHSGVVPSMRLTLFKDLSLPTAVRPSELVGSFLIRFTRPWNIGFGMSWMVLVKQKVSWSLQRRPSPPRQQTFSKQPWPMRKVLVSVQSWVMRSWRANLGNSVSSFEPIWTYLNLYFPKQSGQAGRGLLAVRLLHRGIYNTTQHSRRQ